MEFPHIVSATLGISPPWHVSDVRVAGNAQRLDIVVTYETGNRAPCPCCGTKGDACEGIAETWFHHDFFNFATYLHTEVPHVICCGHAHAVERPWARPGSKFVKLDSVARY